MRYDKETRDESSNELGKPSIQCLSGFSHASQRWQVLKCIAAWTVR